jgi:hypothetical protein
MRAERLSPSQIRERNQRWAQERFRWIRIFGRRKPRAARTPQTTGDFARLEAAEAKRVRRRMRNICNEPF